MAYPVHTGWGDNDIVITTLDRYSHKLFDNVTTAIPLLKRFKEGKRLMIVNGGKNLEEPIMQGLNSTPTWYWLDDDFTIKQDQILSHAIFSWRQMVATVQVAGSEIRQNAGDETRRFDLLKTRIHNMELSFMNALAGVLYTSMSSELTGNGLLQINSLDFLVNTNPNAQTSVGGLTRNVPTNPDPVPPDVDPNRNPAGGIWWQNQVFKMTDFGTATNADPTNEQLLTGMSHIVRKCTRNSERPSIIIMSNYFYALYEKALRATKSIISTGVARHADSELSDLTFSGIPILWDVNCPDNKMYFLNEEYMKFKVHSGANFKTEEPRIPYNKDIKIYPMIFMGQMTISNSHLQAVLLSAKTQSSEEF